VFYLDSADLSEIDMILSRGLAAGVTTNPTLLMKVCSGDPLRHLRLMINKMVSYSPTLPLSVQVMTSNPLEMREQALRLRDYLSYEHLVIKIPVGLDEMTTIYQLSKEDIYVNCTCCMTEVQVSLAASAGAKYASVFYGKASDAGIDPQVLVRNSVAMLKATNANCKLIVGSIRTPWVVTEIIRAGADIVTAPAECFASLLFNDKTKEAIDFFAKSFPEKPWI
jgi:transaldolase